MPDSNLSQTLLTAAEAFLSLSYSVIPVWGMADPTRPKVAGVEWSQYQRRRPTLPEIQHWFSNDSFGGLAIVTGSISRLVVLDFDTQESYQHFRTQHSDLTERHIVQTRRGFHIYFHLPPHLHLPSRKGQGIDLLSDGRYVIARPTCIDGHTYKLIQGGQPKTLTQFDIQRITGFLDDLSGAVAPNTAKREFTAFSFDSEPTQVNPKEPQRLTVTTNDLRQMYQGLIAKGIGRNETLFQVSLKARDEGWTIEQTTASLADLHVWQAAVAHHRPETPAQRYTEARKTVQSAFSRPPRPQKRPEQEEHGQIPNSVRERLLRLGETRTFRLLDGLRLRGIVPGMVFTANQALELLKGIVGRDSVYAALQTVTASSQPLFEREIPSPTPPTPANAATETQTRSNKCFIGRAKKPGISPNHRPATRYIMPSNDELCSRLGVKASRSDPISLEDLTTAKQTRMALHRELIRRRPGMYPRRWLARRLGVACETLDAYNGEIEGLHSRPCFWKQPIDWSNLNAVPDGIEVNGAVLVDETGKRYPAKRRIAARLLGKGRRVIYRRQDANYYWYGDTPPNQVMSFEPSPMGRYAEVRPAKSFVRQNPPARATLSTRHPPDGIEAMLDPTKISEPNAPQKQAPPPDYRKPLPDFAQEALSNKLYQTLNERSADPALRMSQFTARRLVHTYGIRAVEAALVLLMKRHGVKRPVGFLKTILRSEHKRQSASLEGLLR